MQLREQSPGVFDKNSAGQPLGSHQNCEPRIPGEPGIWVLIFGDMVAFAAIFCVFLFDRAQAPELFTASQNALNQTYGVINTLLLLTGSLGVVFAVDAIRDKRKIKAQLLIAMAIVSGLTFTCLKFMEYREKFSAGLVPSTNTFWMYYYVLTGLHLLHLVMGLFVLVFCFLQSRRDHLSEQRYQLVEGGACFWHMVDLLWIFIFPLLYLLR